MARKRFVENYWHSMASPSLAVFCMHSQGHFNRVRPVVSALVHRGARVHVFTHESFRSRVQADGGHFVDLFSGFPPDLEDRESLPRPCRAVSFAGFHVGVVREQILRLRVSLILYDSFAVIGRAAALCSGIPYINLCAGHNLSPNNYRQLLQSLPSGVISPICREAVDRLRAMGMADAHPLCFATGLSPYLNLYSEPRQFLTAVERRDFEPVAFFGSIEPGRGPLPGVDSTIGYGSEPEAAMRIYVSFGTVVWKMFRRQGLETVRRIADALAERDDVEVLISLGGRVNQQEADTLCRGRVRVLHLVDQWSILQQTDLFVTHHGLSSTHEAIYHRVPMLSYPWFGDQIGLARRCQDLGLALPLTEEPRTEIRRAEVHRAVDRAAVEHERLGARLAEARGWELQAVANRGKVVDRILAMARTSLPPPAPERNETPAT